MFNTVYFVCLFVLTACPVNGDSMVVNVTFYPTEIRDLVENTVRNLTLQCLWNASKYAQVTVTVTPEDVDSVRVIGNSTFLLLSSDISANATVIQLEGKRIAKTGLKLTFAAIQPPSTAEPLVVRYPLGVVRPPNPLDAAFNAVIAIVIGVFSVTFGCTLDLEVVKGLFKKPLPLIVGFLCQYTLMPLIAYGLGALFSLPPELAFGLFVMGACPGGGASNIWSALLDGDINLSITMTLISVTSSLGMLPLWVLTLGMTILDADVIIPFTNILISLAALLLPLIVGLLIRKFLPRVAKILAKLLRPVGFVLTIFIVAFNVFVNTYIYAMLVDWRISVACMLLPYTGLLLSRLVALACRRPRHHVKTIMFETAIQNTAVAMLLLRTSLPMPEGDLAAVMPVAASTFTPVPLLIWLLGSVIYKKCHKRDKACEMKADFQRQTSELQLTADDGAEKHDDA